MSVCLLEGGRREGGGGGDLGKTEKEGLTQGHSLRRARVKLQSLGKKG